MTYQLDHDKLHTYFYNRGIEIVHSDIGKDRSQVVTNNGLVYEVPHSKHLVYMLEYIEVIANIDRIIAETWKRV